MISIRQDDTNCWRKTYSTTLNQHWQAVATTKTQWINSSEWRSLWWTHWGVHPTSLRSMIPLPLSRTAWSGSCMAKKPADHPSRRSPNSLIRWWSHQCKSGLTVTHTSKIWKFKREKIFHFATKSYSLRSIRSLARMDYCLVHQRKLMQMDLLSLCMRHRLDCSSTFQFHTLWSYRS